MLRHVLIASLIVSFTTPLPRARAADDSTPELVSTTAGKGGANQWDSVEAMQKAAEAGNPEAGYQLGEMYLNGVQVPVDAAKAVALLERAADAGHANAAFRLGKLNADGEVIPKNLAEALRRYQAAAGEGVAEAQFNLGAMYASGRGVKRDYVEGLAWLIVATKNGADPEGEKQLRDHLTKAKRTAMIADAEKRAAAISTPGGNEKAGSGSGEKATGSPTSPKPAGAPAVTRPDGKVKLGEPAAPDRIQIAPPAPGGLSIPAIPPPPPKVSPPAPPSSAPAAEGK